MDSEEAMMLARVRDLAAEAMLLCEELHAPAAANHIQLGLDLLEKRVHPHRFHILPEDLPHFTATPRL